MDVADRQGDHSPPAALPAERPRRGLAALVRFFTVTGERDLLREKAYASPKHRDTRPHSTARGLQSKLTEALDSDAVVETADAGETPAPAAKPRLAGTPLRHAQMSTGTSGESWDEF